MQQAVPVLITQSLRESLELAVRRGLSPFKKPEPLKLSEWADKHFYLSAESSSIEGRWETLPYQRGIMNIIGNDDVRIVSLMKSARVGYTKIICAAVAYNIEHRKRNQLIYQPTDSDAEDFVKDEIGPMVRDIPVVRRLLRADPDKRSKFNTHSKKSFIGSTLDIRGGKSARNYRRMTKDVVYYDELDGFDQDIEGEGSPTSLGDMRLTTSSFPKSVRGSTPGVKGVSAIEASKDEADMVFRRYLPCPKCKAHQFLKWSNISYENRDPKTVKYACEHCGYLIDYSQYPDMDAQGQWRTEKGVYLDDDDNFRGPDGALVDPPFHAAFIIWAAYSYFTSWSELVAEWIAAIRAKEMGDPSKLKAFINTRLGECWEDSGMAVNDNDLLSRRENYGPSVPAGAAILTAGVDIQDDRFEIEVVGWGLDFESWSVEYNVIYGDPAKPDIWKQLDDYLLSTLDHESGTKLRIVAAGVDTGGHHTQQAYSYCRSRFARRIFAFKGVAGDGPVVKRPDRKSKAKIRLFQLGANAAKELHYSRLKIQQLGPGYCHFPAHYEESYFEQLTAEKRITKYVRGQASRLWVLKTNGRRNEAQDCRLLAIAALELLGPKTLAIALRHMEQRIKQSATERSSDPAAPALSDAPEPETPKRQPAPRRRGGFITGWK